MIKPVAWLVIIPLAGYVEMTSIRLSLNHAVTLPEAGLVGLGWMAFVASHAICQAVRVGACALSESARLPARSSSLLAHIVIISAAASVWAPAPVNESGTKIPLDNPPGRNPPDVDRGVATGVYRYIYPKSVYLHFFMWLFCLILSFIPTQIKFLATPLDVDKH